MKLKPRQRASARRAPRWSRACLAFGRAALPKRVPAQGALRDNKTTSTPSQRNLRALRGAPYALWAAIALLVRTPSVRLPWDLVDSADDIGDIGDMGASPDAGATAPCPSPSALAGFPGATRGTIMPCSAKCSS
mmetsp:Transcript_73058/g.202467  ORF Transcript_73058/g.202467 Transcript_73058/m.202467 type:complete len:134 (-) Transcript_73058:130-531(-)